MRWAKKGRVCTHYSVVDCVSGFGLGVVVGFMFVGVCVMMDVHDDG